MNKIIYEYVILFHNKLTIQESNNEIEGFAFRSIAVSDVDGLIIAGRSSGQCCIFDYSLGKELKLLSTFEAHKSYLIKCIFNPEKK